MLYATGGTEALDEKGRAELLRAARAGESVELEIEAVTYIQRETPNRNFVRFKPGILASFAKSFEGQPMLRDHASWSLDARGGTIVKSKLEHNEDGSKQIRMRLKLVKGWAVEAALDGTLDRFSIGWSRTGVVECSIHEDSWLKCDCWPGDKAADGRVMQLVFTAADGTEVSGVNVPAVVGTRIDSISQLEAIDPGLLADILTDDATPSGDQEMKILAAMIATLGLKADATEEQVLAAAQEQADRLAIATASAKNVTDRLATIEATNKKREETERASTIEAGIVSLIAAGKLKPDKADSSLESALRRQGARDLDVFAATVKDLLAVGATITPVGAALPVAKADPSPTALADGKAFTAANPTTAAWLKAAGITEEQFEKHGGNGREIVAALQSR